MIISILQMQKWRHRETLGPTRESQGLRRQQFKRITGGHNLDHAGNSTPPPTSLTTHTQAHTSAQCVGVYQLSLATCGQGVAFHRLSPQALPILQMRKLTSREEYDFMEDVF